MRSAPLLLTLASCALDRPIDMQLVQSRSSATAFDTSCVTGIEVRAIGTSFATDPKDVKTSCLAIDGKPSVSDIRAAISGKFTLALPDTGLAGVAMYAWSGPNPCDRPSDAQAPDPLVVFYASQQYIGQDTVELDVTPNVGCATSQVTTRPVDVVALASGTAPSSASCASQPVIADGQGIVQLGTLMARPFGRGVDAFALPGAPISGGTAAVTAQQQVMSNRSCLAVMTTNANGNSISCAISGPAVCAGSGETEVPYLSGAALTTLGALDPVISKFPDVTLVAVWDDGAPKHPIAGAKVSVDPAKAAIIYVDAPIARRADQTQTGPSGLFVVYARSLVDVQIAAPGKAPRTVTVGAPNLTFGSANVVMQ